MSLFWVILREGFRSNFSCFSSSFYVLFVFSSVFECFRGGHPNLFVYSLFIVTNRLLRFSLFSVFFAFLEACGIIFELSSMFLLFLLVFFEFSSSYQVFSIFSVFFAFFEARGIIFEFS